MNFLRGTTTLRLLLALAAFAAVIRTAPVRSVRRAQTVISGQHQPAGRIDDRAASALDEAWLTSAVTSFSPPSLAAVWEVPPAKTRFARTAPPSRRFSRAPPSRLP
jgi:hypothetical protein